MDTELTDRVVLVTGATGGIGLATARAYAAEGARVALTYRDSKETAEELVREFGADRALAVRYALSEPDSGETAVEEVRRRWGRVDVLVANAYHRAGRRAAGHRFEDVPAAEWQATLTDNLTSTVRLCQLVLGGMREAGWGRIVLLSSHAVGHGRRGQETYAAVKAGLHGFTRSLAWEAGEEGVLVNVVAPGLTRTEAVLEKLPPALREEERSRTATAKLSDPADIAAAVVFLGSGANRNITGQVLEVSGGR